METTRVTGANIGFDSIESVQLRILNNTKKDENGCWIWQKCLDQTGYGAASISRDGVKRKIGAHVLFLLQPRAPVVWHTVGKHETCPQNT